MPALTGGDALGLTESRAERLDDRIVAATLRCVARHGVRKTTLDDVAAEAGCSRASIYRSFAGKSGLLASAAEREAGRVLGLIDVELARATSLEDALVAAITGASRALAEHAALLYLMEHEPGVVLPYLSFHGLDPVLDRAVAFLAPSLERFLSPADARRAAEWAARLVVLYAAEPGAPFDLTDRADARRLVVTYVLPGLVQPTDRAIDRPTN